MGMRDVMDDGHGDGDGDLGRAPRLGNQQALLLGPLSSSARRSTPCRARRRPSACRTPRGDSISRQASGVSRSDPRAIQACSVTQESPCHPTESRGVELCRNPATGGESSCHHLAARLVGIVCCRTSSAPNKKMKSFDSLVATVLLILNGHSGSSPSPSPPPSPCHHNH